MHKIVVNQVMLAMVQWRDSGQPIPEGDDARERIRELEARQAKEQTSMGDPA
jgi:hypothetical protein